MKTIVIGALKMRSHVFGNEQRIVDICLIIITHVKISVRL